MQREPTGEVGSLCVARGLVPQDVVILAIPSIDTYHVYIHGTIAQLTPSSQGLLPTPRH
jgi:hypothetical protein